MKKKDYIDLKGKTIKELIKMASDKKMEAIKKKMEILGGREKNLKLHRQIRAEVAKILTLIREKEILEKLAPREEAKTESKKELKGKEKGE
jgi:ribosomal protein L29